MMAVWQLPILGVSEQTANDQGKGSRCSEGCNVARFGRIDRRAQVIIQTRTRYVYSYVASKSATTRSPCAKARVVLSTKCLTLGSGSIDARRASARRTAALAPGQRRRPEARATEKQFRVAGTRLPRFGTAYNHVQPPIGPKPPSPLLHRPIYPSLPPHSPWRPLRGP
jgi:hypothetical protein